jgi:hypothetical protein
VIVTVSPRSIASSRSEKFREASVAVIVRMRRTYVLTPQPDGQRAPGALTGRVTAQLCRGIYRGALPTCAFFAEQQSGPLVNPLKGDRKPWPQYIGTNIESLYPNRVVDPRKDPAAVDNYGNPEDPRRDLLLYPPDPARPAVAPSITPADAFSPLPAYGIQMKRRRPVGAWLLTLATLGIYGLIHWYKIHSELLKYDRRRHISPVFELMSVCLMAWTVILPFMSVGSLAQKIRIAQVTAGGKQSCSGTRGILLALLFGAHIIYYQRKVNEIIAANAAPPGDRIRLNI